MIRGERAIFLGVEATGLDAGTLRLFRRVEYDRMVELGFFANERIELLDGFLVPMSPQNAPHSAAIQRLTRLLQPALVGRADVRVQLPLAVSELSEPEPDLAVVPAGDYDRAHPHTGLLVVEVADSSLATDRRKARAYAMAGVPEYWIVNLVEAVIEVHTGFGADSYAKIERVAKQASRRLTAFPDVEIHVADVLR